MIKNQKYSLSLSGLLFVVLFLSSCGWFKKAPKDTKVYDDKEQLDEIKGKKVFNPETGKYEEIKLVDGKMDTVEWKDADLVLNPPILSETILEDFKEPEGYKGLYESISESEMKDRYEVGLILPFLTQNYDATATEMYSSSLWAINFYGGLQVALAQLEKEGLRLDLEVFDSKANAGYLEKNILRNPDLKKKDLIIGPYRRDNISLVADFAKINDITFISPYSASTGLSPLNHNYIQVNPTFNTHCQALAEHALAHFAPSNIILVARNKEEATRFPIFQDALKTTMMTNDSVSFEEFIVPESYTDFDETMLEEYLKKEGPIAFIVPSWSDEIFVSNFLRVVDIARIVQEDEKNKAVRVYGMPQWKEFSKVDYDYFEKLDLHISSASFIRENSLEVKKFRKDFYKKYNTLPTEEAYLGFDIMMYFGRMLHEHGTKFQARLEEEPGNYLERDFEIEPVLQEGSTAEQPGPIEQFENKAIFILRYKEYKFQPSTE